MTTQIHTLPNGFRIVTEHMPGLESASIGIWVNAGGRHERQPQNGIAHFLEHMAFKGTKKRNALEIAEAIEDVGGYINAYTSREVTAYYARILKGDVALALDVIGDIVLNPIFDANEIEIERGVILQEIGQSLDTPDDVIFDWLQERAYPDQPIGRTILGAEDRVRAFGRDDLSAFVAEHYRPDRMILSAAGGVDHDEIVRIATEMFGDMRSGPTLAVDIARFQGGEYRTEKALEQAHFALGLESPDYCDPEIYTAQIYSTALGGGMSSRLFQEIREKRGLCYSIYAQTGAYADTGMTTIYAGTSGDQIADLAEITIDELKRAAEDMNPSEIARARTQMKAGMLMGLESPSSRAERQARMLAIWDRIPSLSETVERIDGVSDADVRRFAEHMAVVARPALALYGPIEAAPALERLQERRAA
ncbi:pitrilysin family protein [uncultured Shimia sp.]|uniref:M16 family metallopeptidase n=1 Tax=uncultured Shimia sp. TaxID=573152 RepID=UPI00260F81A1|nr:pitrilysin family protein [uncultured Shimia sp.]